MEIEITDKKTNPFFNRTEVHFTITHENQRTPNQSIIRNELANTMNVKKDQIIIDTIESSFGFQHTKGYAKIYSSRKQAETIERKHILDRNKVSEAKPKKKEEEETETTEQPSEEASTQAASETDKETDAGKTDENKEKE